MEIITNGTKRVVPDNEPVFLLRAQDKVSAEVVRFWANLAEANGASEDIVKSARELAAQMDEWPVKKVADLPTNA